MKLLNEKQTAEILGLTPITLRKQRCIGVKPGEMPMVPFIKMGSRVRYLESDVIAYVQALKGSTGSES